MPQSTTHYDCLQIKETASEEVIKGAYRYLSQKWHPDKNPHNREEAERIITAINQAYDILSDPIKRKIYDDSLRRRRKNNDGARAGTTTPPPPGAAQGQQQEERYNATPAAKVRPWVRFWARLFDIYTSGVLAGLIVALSLSIKGNAAELGMLILFLWVFIEATLLSTVGTTPGKWLLRTKITHKSGHISFNNALSRSFKVWWRGLGIGYPLISLITVFIAYGKLLKNKKTSWDADCGFVITHERIGALRIILGVFIVVAFPMILIASVVLIVA